MKTRRSMMMVATVLLAALSGPGVLHAQVAQPPDASVAAAESLAPAQEEQIKAFVAARGPGLMGDASEIKRTRDDVLKPLQANRVSVAFRLEYAKQVGPVLEKTVAEGNEQQVVNALRIAGELAAPRSIAMLKKALADPRQAVRYGAVFGIARFFDATGRTGPAASADQLADLIKSLAAQAAKEADPIVLDGHTLALGAAVRVPESAVKDVRGPALAALAKIGDDRAKALAADSGKARLVEMLFRICGIARGALTDIQQGNLPATTTAACGSMAASILAACDELAKAPDPGVPSNAVSQLKAAAAAVQDFAKAR
ncbi:MAG: hypothetical protein ACKVS8_12445 [Phycisphaerales bacterium]